VSHNKTIALYQGCGQVFPDTCQFGVVKNFDSPNQKTTSFGGGKISEGGKNICQPGEWVFIFTCQA
jgi:hypothetical protein